MSKVFYHARWQLKIGRGHQRIHDIQSSKQLIKFFRNLTTVHMDDSRSSLNSLTATLASTEVEIGIAQHVFSFHVLNELLKLGTDSLTEVTFVDWYLPSAISRNLASASFCLFLSG